MRVKTSTSEESMTTLNGKTPQFIVMPLFAETKLSDALGQISDLPKTVIDKLLRLQSVDREAQFGTSSLIPTELEGVKFFLVGLGRQQDYTQKQAVLMTRYIIRELEHLRQKDVIVMVDDLLSFSKERTWSLELFAQNCELAHHHFLKYKTPPAAGWFQIRKLICSSRRQFSVAEKRAITRGQVIGQAMNITRDLTNEVASNLNPPEFVRVVKKIVKTKRRITCRVLEATKLRQLGLNGLLAIGQGSQYPARLLLLEYKGTNAKQKPMVIVGKGITYDTGGISLKSSTTGMLEEMHMDKSGAAATVGACLALNDLQYQGNVVGIIPLAENMLDSKSIRPGDIVRMFNGKNVCIDNTDAEGRVILADALTYAQRFYAPQLLVDIGTLTGLVKRALGSRFGGICALDEELLWAVKSLSEQVSDPMWPFPLNAEYMQDMVGENVDLLVTGKDFSQARTSKAAAFLAHFVEQVPWCHIDLGGRESASKDELLDDGANAAGVRLLIALAEKYLPEL